MIVSEKNVSDALACCQRCGAPFKPQHNSQGLFCSNRCSSLLRFGSLRVRFDKQYIPEPNSGCWIWVGTLNRLGYGMIKDDGKDRTAHRVSFELERGSIPTGLHVLHRCDVRCCVNPDHLFLGTHQDNMTDMARKGRATGRPR